MVGAIACLSAFDEKLFCPYLLRTRIFDRRYSLQPHRLIGKGFRLSWHFTPTPIYILL
jgi:hypothetical protein